jgi:hypothetical protein
LFFSRQIDLESDITIRAVRKTTFQWSTKESNKMKYQFRFLVAMFVLALAAVSATARAQSNVRTVSVPFAFYCGDHYYAAGTYTFFNVRASHTIRLVPDDYRSSFAMYSVDSSAAPSKFTGVVFVRYGDGLHMTKIVDKNAETFMKFPVRRVPKLSIQTADANPEEVLVPFGAPATSRN